MSNKLLELAIKKMKDMHLERNVDEIQPDTSMETIISLEKKYSINTKDFINKTYDSHIKISKKDQLLWENSLWTFILYKGKRSMINTIDNKEREL